MRQQLSKPRAGGRKVGLQMYENVRTRAACDQAEAVLAMACAHDICMPGGGERERERGRVSRCDGKVEHESCMLHDALLAAVLDEEGAAQMHLGQGVWDPGGVRGEEKESE